MSATFLGLCTIVYHVPELASAKEFYSKILGIAPYFDEPYYVGYNVAGYELGLTPGTGRINDSPASTTYWGVQDVQQVYDALLQAGAQPYETPQDVGDGIVVAAVKDPWGNTFGIIYNPHFKPQI